MEGEKIKKAVDQLVLAAALMKSAEESFKEEGFSFVSGHDGWQLDEPMFHFLAKGRFAERSVEELAEVLKEKVVLDQNNYTTVVFNGIRLFHM